MDDTLLKWAIAEASTRRTLERAGLDRRELPAMLLLAVLDDVGGEASHFKVREQLGYTPTDSAYTRAIAEAGVEVVAAPEDRRRKVLRMSEEGRKRLAAWREQLALVAEETPSIEASVEEPAMPAAPPAVADDDFAEAVDEDWGEDDEERPLSVFERDQMLIDQCDAEAAERDASDEYLGPPQVFVPRGQTVRRQLAPAPPPTPRDEPVRELKRLSDRKLVGGLNMGLGIDPKAPRVCTIRRPLPDRPGPGSIHWPSHDEIYRK